MAKEAESSSRKKAEEETSLLRHLVHSIEESERKLEEFYKKNKIEEFNKAKKAIIQLNEKMSEILK
ncbi:MAG: hypothetical protein PHH00_01440 [Candidatus Nanoarchaeia archaeon]|nr:hypothetical protein [Candidatus Nanoarchaeia archaeon]